MNVQGNIYAQTREGILASYADRIEGGSIGIVLVIFAERISSTAKDALEKSFAAIGFDKAECAFANIEGLSTDEAFDVVEGIDPLVLVATDEQAAALYAEAVRQPFPLLQKTRVFGREARAFPLLNSMMEAPADKQVVWHLLKSLA